jgi:thioredoxin-related protein
MVRIKADSATSVPLWLLIAVVVTLGLRLFLSASESSSPQKPVAEINWCRLGDDGEPASKEAKLRFYYFEADWCEPCQKMSSTAFLSRDVVSELNRNFVCLKIKDRKREDNKNSAAVQKVEDKFSVQAFPTCVVAMPDGTEVMDHLGSLGPRPLRNFLKESVDLSAYFRGKEETIRGDFRSAAASFDEFLSKTQWHHWRSPFAAVFSSTAHRALGEANQADRVVADGLQKIHEHNFPYPVLQYLAGKLSFDALLSESGENTGNRTVCYAYTGMDCFARKQYDEAKERLGWVTAHCDDKNTFEYRVALAELEHIKRLESGSHK